MIHFVRLNFKCEKIEWILENKSKVLIREKLFENLKIKMSKLN